MKLQLLALCAVAACGTSEADTERDHRCLSARKSAADYLRRRASEVNEAQPAPPTVKRDRHGADDDVVGLLNEAVNDIQVRDYEASLAADQARLALVRPTHELLVRAATALEHGEAPFPALTVARLQLISYEAAAASWIPKAAAWKQSLAAIDKRIAEIKDSPTLDARSKHTVEGIGETVASQRALVDMRVKLTRMPQDKVFDAEIADVVNHCGG